MSRLCLSSLLRAPAGWVGVLATCMFICSTSFAATERWERHGVMSTPDANSEGVVFSWQGGEWQYKDMSGFIRMVFAENTSSAKTESAAQRAYLQWVRTDEGLEETVYSIAIKELSSVPTFVFEQPNCTTEVAGAVEEGECDLIALAGRHVYEETVSKFAIKVGGLGQYKLLVNRK